ncbi:MAG: UvrD-helicase domain-containing protein [Bacteroidota bacterium]
MNDYLSHLNDSQREAVLCTEGPVMIVAGAGSGKTRVLTYRIAHLLHKGIDAFNILALTFTNKAAREMKERVINLIGSNETKNLWIGTFHSVFARILRYEHDKLNYPSNFTIYDTDDSKHLIKDIVRQMDIDDKIYKPSTMLGKISKIKTLLITPQEYNLDAKFTEQDRASGRPQFGTIFETYCKRCFKAGAMDFDDILTNTNVLLRDFPDILYKYQNKFRFILVDEYQDTNFVQYIIIKQLAARFENICVVGDDAQSIYAFRGANIQNILNFKENYPDVHVFKLEQNYRSTKNIVNAANSIIVKNKQQIPKIIWTDNEEGEKIKVMNVLTDNEEGIIVTQNIFDIMMNAQAKPSEFAILYRTNAQSRVFEESLRKKNIPYRIYGGLSFYQRKEIKDLLAYFRLAINNHDEESLKRIINYPVRGIGNTTINKLIITANDHNISIYTVLENISAFNLDIAPNTTKKIEEFITMIKSFSAMIPTHNAYDIGNHIASTTGILKDLYNDKSPEGVNRYENIDELLNALKFFSADTNLTEGNEQLTPIDLPNLSFDNSNTAQQATQTLDVFMSDIALLTDADKKENPEDRNHVSLMTIHQAKGLEFAYVFIVGLEENLFPSYLSMNDRADMEEERRLFYVALTRAQKKTMLCFANTRYHRGSLINTEPSRFIEEIDAKYLEFSRPSSSLSNGKGWCEEREQWNRDITDPISDETVLSYKKKSTGQETREKRLRKENSKSQITNPKSKKLVNLTLANYKSANGIQEHLKNLQVGMTVFHERFGNGKVINMEGNFPNSKATVHFDNAGQKQLLIKFARLKIVI